MTEDEAKNCPNCGGERWVCENHAECAWPDVCDCGAGMPCPACNACDENTPPAMPPDSVTIWDRERGYLQ
jgi:hypothetical protein